MFLAGATALALGGSMTMAQTTTAATVVKRMSPLLWRTDPPGPEQGKAGARRGSGRNLLISEG